MIVVDASIIANAIGDDGADGQRARAALGSDSDLAAPDLVDVETIAVLRKRWLAGTVDDERFTEAIADLERLPFERVPTLRFAQRAYQLRANVTAYDATYVALAEMLGCELLTADQHLANASGPRCSIRVLQ